MKKKNVSSFKFVLPLTYFVVISDAFKKLVYNFTSPPPPTFLANRKSFESFQNKDIFSLKLHAAQPVVQST